MLCGTDGTLKASLLDLLLGQREQESSSICVTSKGEVFGHLITLVEMPALYNTQLSESDTTDSTLCLSLCDPGVHAFLIIIPEGPLTDEDKAEIETFQRMFSSRVNDHTIFIINTENKQNLDDATKSLIKGCKGHINVYRTTGSELLKTVVQMVTHSDERCYTSDMFLEETQLNYKSQYQEFSQTIVNLKKHKSQSK